jgi:hypothetical protein
MRKSRCIYCFICFGIPGRFVQVSLSISIKFCGALADVWILCSLNLDMYNLNDVRCQKIWFSNSFFVYEWVGCLDYLGDDECGDCYVSLCRIFQWVCSVFVFSIKILPFFIAIHLMVSPSFRSNNLNILVGTVVRWRYFLIVTFVSSIDKMSSNISIMFQCCYPQYMFWCTIKI